MQSHAPAELRLRPLLLFMALLILTGASPAQPQPPDDESCAPAACGNLTIKYPFWLIGRHTSSCGFPTFGVTCSDDPTGATPPTLSGSYLRLIDIRYGDRTVVAFHARLASGGACRAMRFNVSTSLALSQLAVSAANWELFFRANCTRAPPPPAEALRLDCPGAGTWSVYAGRRYQPGDGGIAPAAPPAPPAEPAGCSHTVVPVLPGSELRTWDDYPGIVGRGFMLEWTVPGDCAACNATGGRCRYEDGANAFGCLCPGGSVQPATCGPNDPDIQTTAYYGDMCWRKYSVMYSSL
ncbi:LEAF RUST 10 DISEASE-RESISTANCEUS RECEPTOR-LIKE PROTEIN KINASE-like 1.2 [Lolium perenne]|uniref:LEAF RUST 10 DISEASE-RESISTANCEUS RECEPTOR-LIKE PROTEIN KINASE-like 1.2 n=1 Tax=Lolium perenne TaxID=4522 RepID=UPI0021F654FD|nr:uncharacterized protein LOC127339208 [Lolium perenne]